MSRLTMPRFAANLSLLFTEWPFIARFEAAAAAGFRGVECQFPYEVPAADIATRLAAAGLELVLFNAPPGDFAGGERGIAALPGREREFMAGLHRALAYATTLACPRVHVMSGLRHHGADRAVLVRNLRAAAPLAASAGVTLLVEPINPRDLPGYLLNRTEDALDIVDEVGAGNVALQFDLYHRQVVQGDLIHAVRRWGARAAHVQIAQPPDRGEPDRGEIRYEEVLAALRDTGYSGWVGCEYRPRQGTLAGLTWLKAFTAPDDMESR